MRFSAPLGDGYSLVLRTLDTVDEMLALTIANQERLRTWEPWADAEQTAAGMAAFTRSQLGAFAAGSVVPTLIASDGRLLGSAGLRLREGGAVAELGYWVDAAHEGKGAVSRACAALVEHAAEQGARRIEIRTAPGNTRSVALATRLGFARADDVPVRPSPHDRRLELAVYRREIQAETA